MTSPAPIEVAIVGPDGRLGRTAVEVLRASEGIAVRALIRSGEDLAGALRASGAAVALDVTRAGLGYAHGRTMLACGVRPVIGTSGVGLDENAALDAQARELGLGGIVVPNFSLGMYLLQRAAVEAARHFAKVEILEMHHERKRDAPSGTALDTAERMRAARADPGAEIPIHSMRLPGTYAHQLVVCGAPGELYSLRHDMSGPEAFAGGIVAAVRYAARAIGVARGLGAALDARA